MRRNLLFYLYPVRGSLWPWHLEQLRGYWDAFNGKKIILVARDARTAALSAVARGLSKSDAQLVSVRNDPRLGEARHFLKGLERLRSARADELTFYAHGKGVTRWGKESLVVQSWCQAMYFMNLSSTGLIDRAMESADAAGCFRHEGGRGRAAWHFSGTFFWFKHSALFSRRWKEISPGRYGVEDYLGRHLPVARALPLTPERHFSRLYNQAIGLAQCRGWLAAAARAAEGVRP